jgi:hypothetical protein
MRLMTMPPLRRALPRTRAAAQCFGIAALAAALSGTARAETVDIQYGLTLAGLPLGTASLAGALTRDAYKLDVKARMTGLAGMLTSGRGAGTATGVNAGGKLLPSTYALTSGGGSQVYTVRMALKAGDVAAVDISPPLDAKVDRVPVLETHKRGVLDPVSALLFPVAGRGPLLEPASCNRTIPVFDGAGRFDVTMSFSETRQVDVPGYKGPVLVCAARYNPISGHRVNRKSTQFMADNRDMEAWLAPVDAAHTLVPVKIAVRTQVGTTVIEATRFSVGRAAAVPGGSTTASRTAPAE